jgi:hypothetical protein
MSALTVFYQQCPICGRNLRIPTKYFGREMTCSHCEGEFRAGHQADEHQMPALPRTIESSVIPPSAFSQSQLREV